MTRRRDPITEELHLSKRQIEKIRRDVAGLRVGTDKEAAKAFPVVLQTVRRVGAQVLESLLTYWIEQLFPHLLPLWNSFIRFLHHPDEGFRWPY